MLSEDRFDEAISDYDNAARIAPQNPKYFHAKGIAYEAIAAKIEKCDGKQKRFDQEELPVEKRYADDMQSYLREDYLQNCKSAIEQYKKAIGVDENFYQSRFHLGRCLAQIFNYTEAIKHYKKIIETQEKKRNFQELMYV